MGPGVTQGDGHRIGGVVGLGDGRQLQDALGHVHDLVLFRLAVAHHRLLHLGGSVLEDLHPQLGSGGQDDPSGLGHPDARGDVGVEEELLNGHGIGLEGLDEGLHVLLDLEQTHGHGDPGRGVDGPAADELSLAPVGLQDAEAHDGIARVDA